eukprot:CAMPEP_0177651470 /NCGR_PEP_ID=MMETSP0447-20121125/12569_1 /TAXON_ID=0 /ORGANISM="Stygamoeba regulata, Strain BSH-02190019" /LENGTH=62 /DNA_ID=CAMNT_0019154561 /DNA_START=352 /DNA_END=540 /DNA_ORIENTATION=+
MSDSITQKVAPSCTAGGHGRGSVECCRQDTHRALAFAVRCGRGLAAFDGRGLAPELTLELVT